MALHPAPPSSKSQNRLGQTYDSGSMINLNQEDDEVVDPFADGGGLTVDLSNLVKSRSSEEKSIMVSNKKGKG